MTERTRETILAADMRGDFETAQDLAGERVIESGRSGNIRGQVDALLLLARTHRHSRDAAVLRRARDAARLAVRLTRIPPLRGDDRLTARAELELAACLVEGGRLDEGFAVAANWRCDQDAAVAGWAWMSMGQSRLRSGKLREAIVQLSNAVAEFGRAPGGRRVRTSRIFLAAALTQAGDLAHGAEILDADLDYWRTADLPRLQIEHHLVLAENRRLRGDISGARTLLECTAALLGECKGMEATTVRVLQQQAACELDWDRTSSAGRFFRRAEVARAGLAEETLTQGSPSVVPRYSEPRRLAARRLPEAAPYGLYGDLASTARELAGIMGNRSAVGVDTRPRPADRSVSRHARRLVEDAERLVGPRADRRDANLSDQAVVALWSQLEELGGTPGAERLEASLLVRAGRVLAALREPRLLEAERLLRRALVRLPRLSGMELTRARASIALAESLRAAGRCHEALPFALDGVELVDAERFQMESGRMRKAWRKEHAPAFECAIDLAQRCERTGLAADLIIYSRAAGVVAQSTARLLQLPRLHYIDGSMSSLGTDDECLFI